MADNGFDLMPGEKMVLFSHPHWWYFWKQAIGGLALLVVLFLALRFGGAVGTMFSWIAIIGFVVWVLDTIYEFVQWRTTRFAVTDQRVAYQAGFFRRTGVSIPLNRVNNVNFEQGFIARLTRNGIVTIESAGETGDSVFENIPDPSGVRSVIFAQMNASETADSQRDAAAFAEAMRGDASAMPSDTPKSAQERLAELDQLHESGLISDEEHAAKRAAVLDGL